MSTVTTATAELTAAQEALATASSALSAARDVVAEFRRQHDAVRAYELRRALLGTKPEPVDAPKAPAHPEVARPTSADVAAANTVVRKGSEFVGAKAVAESAVARAKDGHAKAVESHKVAVANKARMEALVKALRAAPGVIAREQIAAFGDLGPVAINFPVPTDAVPNPPAAVITVNGLPLSAASDGELIDASLRLRLAMRRLAGMHEIPVFVDRANLFNGGAGPWPDDANVVYLLTTQDGGLDVVAGVPGGAE